MKENIRPWGNYKITKQTKIITDNPYSKLSLQYHNNRDEEWEILEGKCEIRIGNTISLAKKGDKYFIPRLRRHRIITNEGLVKILETSTGIIDEDDIVRLEDDYGRVKKK